MSDYRDLELNGDLNAVPDPNDDAPDDNAPALASRSRRAGWWQSGAVAAVVVALVFALFQARQPHTTAPAAPVPVAQPAQTPVTTLPSTPAPTASTPLQPATPAVPSAAALGVVRRFVAAWALPRSPAERSAALQPVATMRLVNTLAPLPRTALPVPDGQPAERSNTAQGAVFTVAVKNQGKAVLVVTRQSDGRLLVSAVGQEQE